MQSPSADPSFKAFLEKLQEQNNRGFATQLVQLKTEREIAGEDDDRREEQLDEANNNLKDLKDETFTSGNSTKDGLSDVSDDITEVQDQLDVANDSLSEIATAIIGTKESIEVEMLTALADIKEAVTGIKLDVNLSELKTAIENIGSDVGKDIDSGHLVATIGATGANTTKLLDEQLKEISLVRKLTEGSVEYSKEAAQYRNTSGRDVESKVSGNISKSGGFIDFETARDTLSGQSERVKKENKINLITSVTTSRPGKATSETLGANLGSLTPVSAAEPMAATPVVAPKELTETPDVVPSRNTSIKRARRERGNVTGNVSPKFEKTNDDDTKWQGLLKEIETGFKYFMTEGLSEKPGQGIFQTPSKEVEKKDREAKVSSTRQENPEADNITSTGEIQADTAKSDLEISKQMLDTTKAQLVELKAIREALAPSTPKELVEQKSAPSSTNEKETEGKTLGDAASEALSMLPGMLPGGGKAGKGIGGKILGGIGKAARVLGPAAAVAGAAYSGFEGYQNTGANFDLKAGEEATTGQKISSTLGGVASGLTFGLLDEKSAAQGIHKAGSAITDFFSGNKNAPVSPATTAAPGTTVAKTSTENADMAREASSKGGANNTVVSNNVSSNNTTKIVPMKASPRPEYTGSALDRYQSRITVY